MCKNGETDFLFQYCNFSLEISRINLHLRIQASLTWAEVKIDILLVNHCSDFAKNKILSSFFNGYYVSLSSFLSLNSFLWVLVSAINLLIPQTIICRTIDLAD